MNKHAKKFDKQKFDDLVEFACIVNNTIISEKTLVG